MRMSSLSDVLSDGAVLCNKIDDVSEKERVRWLRYVFRLSCADRHHVLKSSEWNTIATSFLTEQAQGVLSVDITQDPPRWQQWLGLRMAFRHERNLPKWEPLAQELGIADSFLTTTDEEKQTLFVRTWLATESYAEKIRANVLLSYLKEWRRLKGDGLWSIKDDRYALFYWLVEQESLGNALKLLTHSSKLDQAKMIRWKDSTGNTALHQFSKHGLQPSSPLFFQAKKTIQKRELHVDLELKIFEQILRVKTKFWEVSAAILGPQVNYAGKTVSELWHQSQEPALTSFKDWPRNSLIVPDVLKQLQLLGVHASRKYLQNAFTEQRPVAIKNRL